MPFTLREIAEAIGGYLEGDPTLEIKGVAPLEKAGEGDISFVDAERLLKKAEESGASALIVKEGWKVNKPAIFVVNPRLALIRVLELFSHRYQPRPGIHPTAVIEEEVELGRDVHIGAFTYIGANTRIGNGTLIYPLVYIGNNCKIGNNCLLYPRVVLYEDTEIGNNCIIHSGAVIGADGFGYVEQEEGRLKIPHIGKVVIEDDVEIGANTTIDRATMGETRIGKGTKIDNLVQIAHNVEIGENSVIVAQVGISGSVKIGKGVTIAGQAGIADHLEIGDGAIIAAQAGVIGNVKPHTVVSGYPAREHLKQMRALSLVQKLPQIVEKIEELEKEMKKLQAKGGDD